MGWKFENIYMSMYSIYILYLIGMSWYICIFQILRRCMNFDFAFEYIIDRTGTISFTYQFRKTPKFIATSTEWWPYGKESDWFSSQSGGRGEAPKESNWE